MGQRATTPSRRSILVPAPVSAFRTALGWFAILRSQQHDVLERLAFGHPSSTEAIAAVAGGLKGDCEPADWDPDLKARLIAYAHGERVSFADVPVSLPTTATFGRQVLEAVRRIPYGGTMSYAEVAAACGSPRAARAVGNLMACNRLPIVIPCHRVLASGGRLGGYSAPQGLDMKRRLLRLEGATGWDERRQFRGAAQTFRG